MSEHAGVGVLPFDGMGLYEQPRPPRLVFKMPRVVPDQKTKFEGDELFRRLSRESEVSLSRRKIVTELTGVEKDHARIRKSCDSICIRDLYQLPSLPREISI